MSGDEDGSDSDDSDNPPRFRAPGLLQSQPAPSSGGSSAADNKGAGSGHGLIIPERLAIQQSSSSVTIRANMADGTTTTEEYTMGDKRTVTYGGAPAEREVGWHGSVLVITLKGKKISLEYDYALDDEGHLIMTIQGKGRRGHAIDVKSVYDRVKS
jgi:hypothetical protein